jgi:hypothetical protein
MHRFAMLLIPSPGNEPPLEVVYLEDYGSARASCVEIAVGPGWIGVRDTKQRDAGPILTFGRAAWATFLTEPR